MNLYHEVLDEQIIEEIKPLIEENWSETGHFDRLDIYWEMYLTAGVSCFMLKDDDDLVGVLLFYIGPYPHDKETTYAEQLTFYIRPGYRTFSKEMMEFSEEILRNIGATLVIQSAVEGSRFCNTLTKREFKPLEVRYFKRLD